MNFNLYLWVGLGSALGGMLRFGIGRCLMADHMDGLPIPTILINILGSFVIGFFGTLTLSGTRWAVPETVRIFVMVGLCGGFTTFSSFSLESFDLLRSGDWPRALMNIGLSVVLCLGAVAAGHWAGSFGSHAVAVAQLPEEKYSA